MIYLHVLLAALGSWALAGLSAPGWLLCFAALYPLFRLLGLALEPCRLYAMRIEAGVIFVPWFVYKVFSASLDVAIIVLNPRRHIEPAVVLVSITTRDKRLVTLIGCLLTLTPGTLALDYRLRTGEMFVHVLDTQSVDSVQGAVAEIEQRLMRWVDPNGGKR